jgi:hypothetical protein
MRQTTRSILIIESIYSNKLRVKICKLENVRRTIEIIIIIIIIITQHRPSQCPPNSGVGQEMKRNGMNESDGAKRR